MSKENEGQFITNVSLEEFARALNISVDEVPAILEGLNTNLGRTLASIVDGQVIANFGPQRPVIIDGQGRGPTTGHR